MADRNSAFGIFDSGVGGLTVLRSIEERLPTEAIIYLGDTARVPYGTKSADTVVRYALSCADLLLARGIKVLVVACNTASAFALDALRHHVSIPVIGVIEPGARRAISVSRTRNIGVIGTAGTVSSGAYQRAIAAIAPDANVWCKPCPMFVPLAEEGWTEGDVPRRIADVYLADMHERNVDTLVLGCTHYPLLRDVISDSAGPAVQLVDSADATAQALVDLLEGEPSLRRAALTPGRQSFLVTDAPESFALAGRGFLGRAIDGIEWVDIR